MSRLRQNNSQNYNSSTEINEEFENLVRYINAAEFGNKTIAELLDIIYDNQGVFDANIELRLDSTNGLQYRSGDYTSPEEGWSDIVELADIRGTPGIDFGSIGVPIFNIRFQYTATGGETSLDLAHVATDLFMVYLNGILLVEGAGKDYTTNDTGGTGSNGNITFDATTYPTGLTAADEVVIFKIDSLGDVTLRRTDYVSGGQTNFGFVHDTEDAIQVYQNGLLLKEGGGEDYVLDDLNDLVIFNSIVPLNDKVAIIATSPVDNTTVTGLMTESNYTDLNGLILWAKLAVADGEITQSKVQDLVTTLAATPDITISATTPAPATRFWLDTSTTPNQLKFYDGSQYLSTNPASQVPSFSVTDALKVLQVDATGTVLQFGSVDLSSLIPKTQKGAANGVASLDTNSRLDSAQLPEYIVYDSIDVFEASVVNGAKRGKRIYKSTLEITAISVRTDSGTCDVQVSVDGVGTGPLYAASVTPNEVNIAAPITVDATTASKLIGIAVTSAAAGVNLDVALTVRIKSQ